MKTNLNITQRFGGGIILFCIATLMLTYGCKQVNSPIEKAADSGQIIEGLNINVKYAESYDQTEITFSRYWPGSISTPMNKNSTSNEDNEGMGELMIDYEVTREVIAFDENGYMSGYSEFIEGDGEINMPEALYEKLKKEIPARDSEYDPIIRTEFNDGVERSISKSGKIIYEQSYDPEEFRIDPAILDSIWAMQRGDSTIVDQSVQKNILHLRKNGINFDKIGDYYAIYNKKAEPEALNQNIGEYKVLLDLRTGKELWSASLFSDGRYEFVTQSQYQYEKGIPVLANRVILQYGEVNGKWDIAYRTLINRNNIEVITN